MNTQVNIVRMKLADITPADYNPRKALKAGDREYEQIKASLGTFGLVEPLVWNKRSKRLVGGHQRLSILLGEKEYEADVSVVDLDDQQEKALNVALNRSGLWDFDSLPLLLEGIAENDDDLLKVTGYTSDDVADLLKRIEGPPSLDDLEDEHGRPGQSDAEALWPKLTIQLPREILDRFRDTLDIVPGTSLPERVVYVCNVVDEAISPS